MANCSMLSKLVQLTARVRGKNTFPAKYSELPVEKLSRGDIAIDCGANVGDVTTVLADTGATVYAFEPNPCAFAVLQSRMKRKKNVVCINKGVLDQDGSVKLYLHQRAPEDQVHWSTGSSLLPFKSNVCKDTFVQIEVVDLSAFIVSLNQRVQVLKLDVEGVEFRILKKLIKTGMVFYIDQIFAETHQEKIPQLEAEYQEFQRLMAAMNIRNIDLQWI